MAKVSKSVKCGFCGHIYEKSKVLMQQTTPKGDPVPSCGSCGRTVADGKRERRAKKAKAERSILARNTRGRQWGARIKPIQNEEITEDEEE